MKRIAALTCAALVACAPGTDDETGGAETQMAAADGWIDIANGDRQVATWMAYPEGDGPAPTIIVIHQNRGSSEWVRSVADRLAQEGYIAAAPDLLSGMAPGGGNTADYPDSDAARAGIGQLPPDQVTADLQSVADFLSGLPRSNGSVSVSGFCWGGRQTFRFATNNPALAAAYVFYGDGPQDAEAVAGVGARVYGFYGGEDNRINSTIETTTELMAAGGKSYQPIIYDGAGHGFMSRGETAEVGDPNRAAADASWERWRTLLAENR